MQDNLHTLKGTLYSKDTRVVENKKKPTEPPWEFYSIKVESKLNLGGRERTNITELSLDKGISFDGYEVGDQLEVDFYLTGKAISDSWFKSEAKACFIKFADVQTGGGRKNRQLSSDTTFVAPRPTDTNKSDDEFESDLPF
jgi:hypothetical protein